MILKPGEISRVCQEARTWVEETLRLVKLGSNEWNDDEAIAGEILRQIDAKKREGYKNQGYSDAVIDILLGKKW